MFDPQKFEEIVKERFMAQKWRMTAGVINIVRILANTEIPLSPADMINELDKEDKSMDLATAYRIIERLESIKMAKRVTGKYMPTGDPLNQKDAEHFMICSRTGKAQSIFLNYHEHIASQLKKEKNFTLDHTEITFFGTRDYAGK